LLDKKPKDDNLAFWVIKAWVEVYVDTANALDVEKEKERIKAQILDTKEYIAILDRKLLNESFIKNAPAQLVQSEMQKKAQAEEKLRKLEEKLNKLK
jgi:valyl-tRNA synthetase